jgi:hypothetical protein
MDGMATREELMGGLQFVPAQAKRVAGMLDSANEWDVKRSEGWSPKEMFTHVAATVGMMPKMGPDILKAPPEADIVDGLDIAEFNEQGVASMRSMDAKQAVEALSANCGKLSDWVKSLTDEQLASKHVFRGMPMTMADLLMTVTVMHPVHHLYEASLPVPA